MKGLEYFPDLLNKQVCCYQPNAKVIDYQLLDLLRIMYPTFKVVKSEFEITMGEPFIYAGDIKYLSKVSRRLEPHILVSSTGEYNLSDRNTLIDLAYSHNNGGWMYVDKDSRDSITDEEYDNLTPEKKQHYILVGKKRPKRLSPEYIESFNDKAFYSGWKNLWVTGTFNSEEVKHETLFFDIISNLNSPMKMFLKLFEAIDTAGVSFIENKLLDFIYKSKHPDDVTIKNKFMASATNSFNNSFDKNVSYAVIKLLKFDCDNKKVRLFKFLYDLTISNKTEVDSYMKQVGLLEPGTISSNYPSRSGYDKDELLSIKNEISSFDKYNVILLIGDSVKAFKQMLKDTPYYTITTADEVRQFIDEHSYPSDKPLIFEDISKMTSSVQTYLLKFIENPPAPLIILSSKDNISPIILSRCKRIIKLPSIIHHETNIGISELVKRKMDYESESTKDDPTRVPVPFDTEFNSLVYCPDYQYLLLQAKVHYKLDSYLTLL